MIHQTVAVYTQVAMVVILTITTAIEFGQKNQPRGQVACVRRREYEYKS